MENDHEFQEKLKEIFKTEAKERLENISQNLDKITDVRDEGKTISLIEMIHRDFHSLKGASLSINYTYAADIFIQMEKLFKMFKNNISSVNNKTIQMIKEAVKEIKNLIYDNGFQENIINKHLCNIKQLVSIIPETPIKNIDRSFIEISGNFNKAPCKKKIEETVILIAEDSPTFLEILKDIVSSSGYKVKIAQNGKYAYQILKNEKIDLVISDIQMQEMNGFDLAYNIKNDPELMNIPIIFISSIETDKDAERGISTGADIYITKSSFEKNLLMDIIKKFV